MKNNKEFDKSLLILFAIIIITIVTAISLYFSVRIDKITQIIKDRGVIKFGLVVDDGEGNPLISQVVLINTETNKGALIDIPNEIATILPSEKRYSRLDSVYKEYGVEFYYERIGALLSLDIPYYIRVDKSKFSEIIDLVEGLDLFVSRSNSNSLIPSGSVVLEGDKVLDYIDLILTEDNSTGVVNRKQKIIESFLTQIKSFSSKITGNNILLFKNRLETNLDINSFEKFVEYLGSLKVERLVLQRILGDKQFVDSQELIFPYNSGNLIKIRVKSILKNLGDAEVISDEKLNFTIKVLNGTSSQGLAGRTSVYLSSIGGYTISGVGNADRGSSEVDFTEIWDMKGNIEAAQRLGDLINCSNIHSGGYEEGMDDTIDFTIILGKDFDGRRVKN